VLGFCEHGDTHPSSIKGDFVDLPNEYKFLKSNYAAFKLVML
jgi:hypothetical protein